MKVVVDPLHALLKSLQNQTKTLQVVREKQSAHMRAQTEKVRATHCTVH